MVGTRRGPRFEGRTAVVTGASAGIGRGTAERLAVEGAHVVVTDVDGEGGPYGVRANAVRPSSPRPRWARGSSPSRTSPKRLESGWRPSPLKRLRRPEEVAEAIAYPASDEASYVTGHGLVLDGGYSIS